MQGHGRREDAGELPGREVFRKGVHDYLNAHAYGNAVTDDLWVALDAASQRPVSKVARGFTLQAGVPLIQVARSPQGAVLTQGRFFSVAAESGTTAWDVPVVARPLGGVRVARTRPARSAADLQSRGRRATGRE